MSAFPHLRVVAAARDAAALERTLTHGFGITRVQRHQEEKFDATLFGFKNGDLLILSPRGEAGDFVWLPAQSKGAYIAVGALAAPSTTGLQESRQPIGRFAPLSKFWLSVAGVSGLTVLLGSDPSFSAIDPEAPYALDHIAAVVRSCDASVADLQSRLGAPRWVEGWDFPEFATTNACLRFNDAYVELNEPKSAQGLFGQALAEVGPTFLFVCLRSTDPKRSLNRLYERGYSVQDSRTVHACAPGSTRAMEIGRAHSLSRRQTSGLHLMLFDSWWPWQLTDDHGGRSAGRTASLEKH